MSKAKVGIVYSPGFGAGWASWGDPEQAVDQELAEAIEKGCDIAEITRIAKKNWPDAYLGGISENAAVMWVDEGTLFEIDEYDGSESVRLKDDEGWTVARPATPPGAKS